MTQSLWDAQDRSRSPRWRWRTYLLFAILLIAWLVAGTIRHYQRVPSVAKLNLIRSGMLQSEVRSILGPPMKIRDQRWDYPLPFGDGPNETIIPFAEVFTVYFHGPVVVYAFAH